MKPLISIIIPSYNQSIYVEECITSLWQQDYAAIEIIFVNDGSTDNTYEVIKSLQNISPVPINIINQANQGVVKAMNNGLKLVQGDFITIFNSDDICFVDRFGKQVAYLLNNPEVQAVWSNGLAFGEGIKPYRIHKPQIEAILKSDAATILQYLYSNKTSFFSPTGLFRSSLLKAIDGWDETLTLDDWVLNVRIFEYLVQSNGKHAYLDQDVMYYRQHAHSLSHNIKQHSQGFIKAQERYVPAHLRQEIIAETYWDYGLAALLNRQYTLGISYLWKSQTIHWSSQRIISSLYKLLRYPLKRLLMQSRGVSNDG